MHEPDPHPGSAHETDRHPESVHEADLDTGSVHGIDDWPPAGVHEADGRRWGWGAQGGPSPQRPAPDALSVADSVCGGLDSVSLYGTAESLAPDDASSLGSDSEVNGSTASGRRTDKYGFLGGTQFSGGLESSIPVEVARMRELKWLGMLSHWDKWVARKFDKVKLRCRKGIPSSLRARAWQQLSRSRQLMEQNPGKFEELDQQPGDPKWLDIIEKDLHRQFPFHEMFALRGGHGQQDLYRILKAYTVYQPDEGYCQAQAPVAAVLLMHMPAEQAFWCLVQICEKYLPGYYSAGLEAIQLDGEVLSALLRRVSPLAFRHLRKHKIDPILYMTEWFMCIFARTLPWASVLRVWDMFFCDGVKIIFKVGLVLLRHTLGSADKLRDCGGMYETMEKLRNIPAHSLQEDALVNEVVSLKVSESLIERESASQRRRWSAERGELQHRPSRRLYGARALRDEETRLNPPLASSPSLLGLTASLLSLRRGREPLRPPPAPSPPPSPPPSPSPPLAVCEGPPPSAPPAPLGGQPKGRAGRREERERRERERKARREEERERKEREKREKPGRKKKQPPEGSPAPQLRTPPRPLPGQPQTPGKGGGGAGGGRGLREENGGQQGGAERRLRDQYF